MVRWTYRGAVDFAVLGSLRVTGASGVIEIHGAKERLLLAHLVSRARDIVGMDELIEGLWGSNRRVVR